MHFSGGREFHCKSPRTTPNDCELCGHTHKPEGVARPLTAHTDPTPHCSRATTTQCQLGQQGDSHHNVFFRHTSGDPSTEGSSTLNVFDPHTVEQPPERFCGPHEEPTVSSVQRVTLVRADGGPRAPIPPGTTHTTDIRPLCTVRHHHDTYVEAYCPQTMRTSGTTTHSPSAIASAV